MGIGAVFGAILTMYTAVATRAREIATLRALGFNTARRAGVGASANRWRSARIGGLIGGLIAYVGFNGYQTSTMNFQTFSQVAFAFRVTPGLLGHGPVLRARDGLHRRSVSGACVRPACRSRPRSGSSEREKKVLSPFIYLSERPKRITGESGLHN